MRSWTAGAGTWRVDRAHPQQRLQRLDSLWIVEAFGVKMHVFCFPTGLAANKHEDEQVAVNSREISTAISTTPTSGMAGLGEMKTKNSGYMVLTITEGKRS